MRDIEFRGRDVRGIWRFGSFAQKKINNLIYPCIFTYKEWDNGDYIDERVVEGDTVGQYTGLTDKNGTKIFEGDIFKLGTEKGVFEVRFEHGCFIAIHNSKQYGLVGELFMCFVEVVGNIYDK